MSLVRRKKMDRVDLSIVSSRGEKTDPTYHPPSNLFQGLQWTSDLAGGVDRIRGAPGTVRQHRKNRDDRGQSARTFSLLERVSYPWLRDRPPFRDSGQSHFARNSGVLLDALSWLVGRVSKMSALSDLRGKNAASSAVDRGIWCASGGATRARGPENQGRDDSCFSPQD